MTAHDQTGESSAFEGWADHRDESFDVVSHSPRRFILQYLLDGDPPVSVSKLATGLADRADRRAAVDRAGDDTSAVKRSLVHRHLPKPAETGSLTHDGAARTVALTERVRDARSHLQAVPVRETRGGSRR